MQLERKVFRPAQFGKLALAALLMASLFVSLLLAVSPSLHEDLHHDAAQTSHQCAITTFQQQHLLAAVPNVIIIEVNLGVSLRVDTSYYTAISDYDYRFSASRAPPFLLSPLA